MVQSKSPFNIKSKKKSNKVNLLSCELVSIVTQSMDRSIVEHPSEYITEAAHETSEYYLSGSSAHV